MAAGSRQRLLWITAAGALVALALFMRSWQNAPTFSKGDGSSDVPTPVSLVVAPAPDVEVPRRIVSDRAASGQSFEHLLTAFAKNADDEEQLRLVLARVRNHLLRLPREQALAIILAYLRSGKDLPTGLGFAPGAGHRLDDAPSVRVLLLDTLREIDPQEALGLAREMLAERKSGDEWAVSLRNAVLAEPSSMPEWTNHLRAGLDHPPWVARPPAGVQYTLDLASWTGDRALLPRIAALRVGGAENPWGEASTVALHEFVRRHPAQLVAHLAKESDFLDDLPMIRADLVAQLDPRREEELVLIESRLGDPSLPFAEREKIVLGLASPVMFLIDGLFSGASDEPPTRDWIARGYAILERIPEWTVRFPELAPTLADLREYLEER